MLTATKKCPTCGAKNEPAAQRCRICTRPLSTERDASTAVFEEALWSERIDSKHRERKSKLPSVMVPALLLLAIGLIVNAVFLRLGPDWIHMSRPAIPGSDWRQVTADGVFRVDMPTDPEVTTQPTNLGAMTVWSTWTDENWTPVRGGWRLTPAERSSSVIALNTAQFVAWGPSTPDVKASIGFLNQLVPGATFQQVSVFDISEGGDGAAARTFEVEATYDNWPENGDHGSMTGRIHDRNGVMVVMMNLHDKGTGPAIDQRLFNSFAWL